MRPPFRELQGHVILVDKVSADQRLRVTWFRFKHNATVHRSTAGTGADFPDNCINFLGKWLGYSQYKRHIKILASATRSVDLRRNFCDVMRTT